MSAHLLVFLAVHKTDCFEARLVHYESFSNMAMSCPDNRSVNPLGLAKELPQTDIFSACWDVCMPDAETTFHTLVEGRIWVQTPSG